MMRRTALAVTGRLSARDLERIAGFVAEILGWDAPRRDAELAQVGARLTGRHYSRL